ncbi:hypothetical protein IFM89_014092, partial [Coptis chinensis]
MGNNVLSEEVAIWRISSIPRRLWIDYGVFCKQMDLYEWVRNEVELRLLEYGWNAGEFGLYKRLLVAQWFFIVLQTEFFQFFLYMSPNTNKVLSPSKNPNSVELLAMDFAAKMKMPYTDPLMITSSEKMKSKYVGYNKMTLFGRVLDGRLNMSTIKSALEKAWHHFKIEDMVLYKGEIFQIRMESQEQVAALLLGQPWIIAQHIFQIIPWMEYYETKELNFSKFYVWMHLHNYPETETQPSCVRVKVLLDVHEPIPPGFLIPESIDGVDWISFVFEYLSVFCFKCGFIGHHFAASNVTEASHGNEVRVSPGGQRFQLYSSKTRIVPKPIGDRIVFGFSLLFDTDLNQPLLPMITNMADSSISTDPKKLHFIDLSQLHDQAVQQEEYSYKRQEISQGVAAKDAMKQDRENVNEMVESFFQENREARRKIPVHNEVELAAVLPNILQKNSAGKEKKISRLRVQAVSRPPKDSMSLLAWNSRGSDRPSMMEELKQKIKDVRPIFMFVMETKYSVNKGVSLIKRLGDFKFFCSPKPSIYTWTNRQNGRHRIWERIDRMMANE